MPRGWLAAAQWALLALAGCSPAPQSAAPAVESAKAPAAAAILSAPLLDAPVELSLQQRSTTAIPGTHEQLSVTIDDISRGQVLLSVLSTDGKPVVGPVSLAAGDSRQFLLQYVAYRVTLVALDNQLVGADSAKVRLEVVPTAPTLTEVEKIERLIAAVAALQGAEFIRNDAAHSPSDAAEHLRQKYAAAGEQIKTAREFIEQIGSRSSLTGAEYAVRWTDGREQSAREFLEQQLQAIESPLPNVKSD